MISSIKEGFGGSDDFYAELSRRSTFVTRGNDLETYKLYKNTKELRDELPDMYPHKEFVPPLVKNVIAKAIEDGVDTIAFPTSIPILERTGTQIADIKSLYLTKIGKASQQERDIIDLDTNIDALELGSYQIAPLGGKNLGLNLTPFISCIFSANSNIVTCSSLPIFTTSLETLSLNITANFL
jgi:hypothetical protein